MARVKTVEHCFAEMVRGHSRPLDATIGRSGVCVYTVGDRVQERRFLIWVHLCQNWWLTEAN